MQSDSIHDFEKFQTKIDRFMVTHDFKTKTEYYSELFGKMLSVPQEEVMAMAKDVPDFLRYRNESVRTMEEIVALHEGLLEIFNLDAHALGERFDYNLNTVDTKIANDLKRSANLLHHFEEVSEAGRKAVEKASNPFFAQKR